MAQFRIYALNALPIPAAIDRTSLQNIQNYATALLQSSSKSERLSIEIKIDDEVYKMYGLSQEEVDTITSVMRS